MARFDQRMQASAGLLMWHNADPVTYREDGSDPVELSAILGFDEAAEDDGDFGRKKRIVRDVTILLDPDSEYGGVAQPALNAVVEIGDVEYSVEKIMSQSGTFARLAVKQTRVIERSRRGLRS
jgi:hypothetical protein